MKQNDNRKVGRPKLADTNLKKKSLIISAICLLVVIVLTLTGIKVLNISPNKLKGEASKTYEVGEEFCLDTECFYVIEDNGDSVKAISKYNLYVGDIVDYETGEGRKIDSSEEGYGIQNEQAVGYKEGLDTEVAILYFSETNYWVNDVSSYPAFVFNENSNLYEYVKNYEEYLKNDLGKTSVSATLLSYEKLVDDLCTYGYDEEGDYGMQCLDFISETSFFLGSAERENQVYTSSTDGGIELCNHLSEYGEGIRPVITISKEDMKEDEEPTTEETTNDEVTTTKKAPTTTTAKQTTITNNETKRRKPIIKTRVTTTTTKEETTTSKVIINKITKESQIATTKKIVKENNKNYTLYILGGTALMLLAGVIIYKNKN